MDTVHQFTGQTRCSNCYGWGESMPFSSAFPKPAGGYHRRNFCSKSCKIAWCFRYRIVPFEMLPPDVLQSMRRELLEANA